MAARRIKIRTKKAKALPERAAWPAAGRWLAAGTLVAYSAVGTAKVAVAQQPGVSGGASQQQALSIMQFNIPAGPLRDVVRAFEAATGWRVTDTQQDLLNVDSKGISGPFPIEGAIRQMLSGTNVSYRVTGTAEVTLELRSAFKVDVTDNAPEVSSFKYTSPLRDLPQTISIIPQSVIQQQGATTLSDVLRNVPGLTLTAGEGGTPAGDNLTLRGYSARNDIFVDGVRDLSPQSRDPFNLEQVEVSKGPTSAVTGRGSAGGTINLVSKQASMMRGIGGSFALGNAHQRRATLDINTPLSIVNDRTSFRTNLLWHESGVPGRNAVKNDRWGFAPSLAFGLGTPTRVTLSYYKLKQDNISDYGIPWVPNTNNALLAFRDQVAPVPRETFYGFVNRDREVLNQDTATMKVEHDFTDGYTLRSQLRYGRAGRNSIATPPRFANVNETTIGREMRSWGAQDRIWDNQTDFRANFNTGTVRHALVTGAAFTRENNIRRLSTAPNSLTTLLNPNPNDTYPGVITVNPNIGDLTAKSQALYAFDTVSLGEHWQGTGGARWERFVVDGISTTPAPVTQNVRMTSVRAGLIYKPVNAGSIYGSYGTSLSPSLEGLSYNTANTSIPPEKTYTTELGVKWDLLNSRLLLSSAVFRVAKDNARTPGLLPTDPPQVLSGQQVSKGFEFSATGNITQSLRVLGAYTFINARVLGSNNAAEVGKFFQNTPRHSSSLWLTYTAKKFMVGAGPRYVGERFGNNINTRRVDGYFTMDAMISYNVNEHLDLRFNLTNLNNEYYFDRLGGGHVVPAPARSGLLTAAFRF